MWYKHSSKTGILASVIDRKDGAGKHMPFHPNLGEVSNAASVMRAMCGCCVSPSWRIRAGAGGLGYLPCCVRGGGGQKNCCRAWRVTCVPTPPPFPPPQGSSSLSFPRVGYVPGTNRYCLSREPPPPLGGAFPERAATPFLFSVWYWRLWRLVQPDRLLPPMHRRPHIPASGLTGQETRGDERGLDTSRPVPPPPSSARAAQRPHQNTLQQRREWMGKGPILAGPPQMRWRPVIGGSRVRCAGVAQRKGMRSSSSSTVLVIGK